MEYFNICLETISKQALQDSRFSSNLTVSYPNDTSGYNNYHNHGSYDMIQGALYTSAGRRYGRDTRMKAKFHKFPCQSRRTGSKIQ